MEGAGVGVMAGAGLEGAAIGAAAVGEREGDLPTFPIHSQFGLLIIPLFS
jgi:hypothetical protein